MKVLKCQRLDLILLALEYNHLNQTNKNLIFWMKQKNFQMNAWELLFSKFEFTSFSGKIIVVVGRNILKCNVM